MQIELTESEIAEIEKHFKGYTLGGKASHGAVTRRFETTGRHLRMTHMGDGTVRIHEVYQK